MQMEKHVAFFVNKVFNPSNRRPAMHRFVEPLESRRLLSTNVLTYHYDNSRDGQDLTETTLTPSNVNASTFGKVASFPVDGYVYAQPLYMENVPITDHRRVTRHYNIVFVATEHDSVYAFNADSTSTQPLWQVSFLDPTHNVSTIPSGDTGSTDIYPEIGITSTPVVDPATGTIYVVACTKEVKHHIASYMQRLHALSVSTGDEVDNGPVVVSGVVRGTGVGATSRDEVYFQTMIQSQRMALTLANGDIYFGSASYGDLGPFHGWLMAYNAATLQQAWVFNDTPNGSEAGIWESGDGVAVDAQGDLYFTTGNGTFDANTGGPDYGDSAIQLASTRRGPTVTDYFTPFNQNDLNENDLDLGSGGVILLPAQRGTHKYEMVFAGKDSTLYVVDCNDMGGYNTSGNDIVQSINGLVDGLFSTPAYFNNTLYMVGEGDPLIAVPINRGKLATTPSSTGPSNFTWPQGTTPIVSADGSSNGVVWMIGQDNDNAVLCAYNANNVTNQIYTAEDAGSRDAAGGYVKFVPPVVADGKVFVATKTNVTVYGLL